MATPEPRPGPTSQLCALSGALLGDQDGVYDPAEHNDRLLLGLKGTLSEALCRIPDNASYADIAVMPINRRERPAGRDDGQGRSA